MTVRVINELTDRLGEAALGRSGDDALRALMRAYRSYVVEHPGRYGAMEQTATPENDAAAERLLNVLFGALRGYALEGPALVHAARCLRSAVHGFAVLEAAGGFGLPEDLEASYELLITMITGGLDGARHVA